MADYQEADRETVIMTYKSYGFVNDVIESDLAFVDSDSDGEGEGDRDVLRPTMQSMIYLRRSGGKYLIRVETRKRL